jgi:hypothetical protein
VRKEDFILPKKKFIFTSTTSKQTDFYSSSNSLFSCYDICEELISAFLFNNKIIICRWKMILEEKQTKKWINRGNRIKIEIFFLDWQRNKKKFIENYKKEKLNNQHQWDFVKKNCKQTSLPQQLSASFLWCLHYFSQFSIRIFYQKKKDHDDDGI